MRQTQKTMALWAILLVVSIVLFQMYATQRGANAGREKFKYPQFVEALHNKQIKTVKIRSGANDGANVEISGEMDPSLKEKYGGTNYVVEGPALRDATAELKESGITPEYQNAESGGLMQNLLVSWLPLILIVGMFMFIMRQIQVGGG